ncbi:MAG: CoB--CoM heterodisulfide reductase iron-sulfur subunit B family protein [Nitrospinota bacterium]|nr:CoB--CoM heterodisulfide reductase iron-sulfur subunit B family protein [Nitrospinota bacterium]
MKYAYYPGCSLHSTGAEYDESFRAICNKMEITLDEIPDWVCCGTLPAHSSSKLLSVSLPIKNLALAEAMGHREVVVPCAACYSRFKKALYETEHDGELATEVNGIIEDEYKGSVNVIHPLEAFDGIDHNIIKKHIVRDISNLKVVCYYGCLLTRPPKVMNFDNSEYPMIMDKIAETAGATVLDWSYKTDCCGGSIALSETDMVLELCHYILEEADAVGADAIIVACPLCHSNLDNRQPEIDAKYYIEHKVPILYFSQLIGLAFGMKPEELGLHKHFISADSLL